MSEVVNLFKRTPYVAPEAGEENGPCKSSVAFLEKILEEAKQGKVRGFALLHYSEEDGWFKNYIILNEEVDSINQLVWLSTGLSELQKYVVYKASPQGDFEDDDPEDMSS